MSEASSEFVDDRFPRQDRDTEHLQHFSLSVYDCLLWTAVCLSPLQDTALQNTFLHLPAASASFLPSVALLLITLVRYLLTKPFQVNRIGLIAAVYAVIVCAANFVSVEHGETVFHSTSLIAITLVTVLFLFGIFGVDYRPGRGLRTAVYVAFCLTVVGILCGQLLGNNAIHFLQATPSLGDRPRGFGVEPSGLSVQIVASGMLTAHFLEQQWQKWGIAGLTCALLIFSSSKGGLISLLLCGVVLGILKSRSSVMAKVVGTVLLLPFVYFGTILIFVTFGSLISVNETSTIATRLSMPVYAIITVAHNPFGVGFTGFLPSIPRYLPRAMEFVQSLFPVPLFFGEVKEYLYPPQSNADCKTLFFDYFVWFGIPFAIAYFKFFGGLLRRLYKNESHWLFIGGFFCVTAMLTYQTGLNEFTIPLLFGISLNEVKRIEASVCMC